MENKITKEQWEETNRKMQEFFQQAEEETLKKMPLWMKMNYFSHKISQAFKRGAKDEDLKWDYINEKCSQNLDIFDYNMYENVYTAEDFENQRFNIICAIEDIKMWHKHTCKECNKKFFMSYKEVMFFKGKGLSLPRRCKECRNKRKEAKQYGIIH